MIDRDEIEARAEEFEIHPSNVQRDYVFGWLLFAIFNDPYLSRLLILKGGNCFRKAYFPNTRFSSDLDFSTQQALDVERVARAIDQCCAVAGELSGIKFVAERNRFAEAARANQGRNTERKIYKGKVFFEDFYGVGSSVEISVRMDVTEFDRLYMPVNEVPLIHPYSDAGRCQVSLQCVAVEESIAGKMKCLLQRRHSHDLYDLVYAAFFNTEIDLDRSEIARVFLRKTIFSSSPGSAKQILLGLPMPFFKAAWEKYIVCPLQSRIDFDKAAETYQSFIGGIFDLTGFGDRVSDAFFPAELRNVFMDAGTNRKLVQISYDGITRVVEPYALTYKRPQSGFAREYLYVWDRSGGSQGVPGIRSLVNPKVLDPIILDEEFEPRYEIELSKAGEERTNSYFSGKPRSSSMPLSRQKSRRVTAYSGGPKYVVQCPVCGRQFKRKSSGTALNKHKDTSGFSCMGRRGFSLGWQH